MSAPFTNLDPDWKSTYAHMVADCREAVARVRPGQRVFVGTGCAVPLALVRALAERGPELPDTEITHLVTFGEAPYAERAMARWFRVNSFFIADNVRNIIREGLGDYTPVFLSDIPRLFHSGQILLDVALIHVSPPDREGMCSLGVSVDIVKSAVENAALVIAQVNPNMPRTRGDSLVHVYDLDVLVPVQDPLVEFPFSPATEEGARIAESVAALIEDGSTLEIGFGALSEDLLRGLAGKHDLGIHTELLTDGIVELIQRGAINGSRKTIDRGLVVASLCMGTRELYDYIDNNPQFSFRPTEYVNDPFVISRHERMVSINMALQIDLTGQVCSDSIGNEFFSGVGGQVDFIRGAARSHGGKSIIVLPATAEEGTETRIVTYLSRGSGVVTTRADVHFVVTEFGVAYLHGKSVQERALALISIAHPEFRDVLIREAIEANYLSSEYKDVEGRIVVGPRELSTTHVLANGTSVRIRPIHPTDEPQVRHLVHSASHKSLYYRFMREVKQVPRKQLQDFVYIDHRNEMAIVATVPETYGEEIIAIGRYYLDRSTNLAEVAFLIHDRWQHLGLGTFLVNYLTQIARRNGIDGFTAEVLVENKSMQKIFNRSNCKVKTVLNGNVYSYTMLFKPLA
jgi:acyl-CoA hydrolase/GNAT superfamily N-acetyltransferase